MVLGPLTQCPPPPLPPICPMQKPNLGTANVLRLSGTSAGSPCSATTQNQRSARCVQDSQLLIHEHQLGNWVQLFKCIPLKSSSDIEEADSIGSQRLLRHLGDYDAPHREPQSPCSYSPSHMPYEAHSTVAARSFPRPGVQPGL